MSEALIHGLPPDVLQLTAEVLTELRNSRGPGHNSLNSATQRKYDALGAQCLDFLVGHPAAAEALVKLGPHEEAYGISLARVDNAIVRASFYSPDGVGEVPDDEFTRQPIDIARFGVPHNHTGNIASVVPVGGIRHHIFKPTEGEDYTAGTIIFDVTRDSRINGSRYVPSGPSGLAYVGNAEFDPSAGYWMNKDTIHTVTWTQPSITIFINDMREPHPTTVYRAAGIDQQIERPHGLDPETRARIWGQFVDLARNKT